MGLRPVLSAEASIEPLPVHPGRTHVQLRQLAEPLFSSPIPQQPVHRLYHLMGTQRNQCCTLFKAERFRFTLMRKHLQQLKKPHRSGGNVRKVLKTDLRKFKGICSARHQTAVFVTALPRSLEWDPRDDGQLAHLRIVAVGWPVPLAAVVFVRSFSVERSHRAPAAWLPGLRSGPPLFICGEKKTSSHKPRHFWMIFGLVQRDFFKYFFMFSKPRSTARRTALSSTPSASATSE